MARPSRPTTHCPACGAFPSAQKKPISLPKPPPLPDDHFLLLQTAEKITALFAKIHNLQVEVQELCQANRKLTAVFAALVDDPESRAYAEAQLKKFIQERNQ